MQQLIEPITSRSPNNRFLAFDSTKGIVKAEAGVTFDDILHTFAPRGWFPIVLPPNQSTTIGAAIACNLFGRNQHRDGTIRNHIHEIQLVTPSNPREVINCSPSHKKELFHATIGGLGLTGVILTASLQLRRIETAFLKACYSRASNISSLIQMLDSEHRDDLYKLAWIDIQGRQQDLGRGFLMTAHHAKTADLPSNIHHPFELPPRSTWTLLCSLPNGSINSLATSMINLVYRVIQNRKKEPQIVPYDRYLFPLGHMRNWEHFYGQSGPLFYQCCIPQKTAEKGLTDILEMVAESRLGSPIATLRRTIADTANPLSCCLDGYYLSLVFSKDPPLFALLDRLDEIVIRNDGKINLATDRRMTPQVFQRSYQDISSWLAVKRTVDPEFTRKSPLSTRLNLGESA